MTPSAGRSLSAWHELWYCGSSLARCNGQCTAQMGGSGAPVQGLRSTPGGVAPAGEGTRPCHALSIGAADLSGPRSRDCARQGEHRRTAPGIAQQAGVAKGWALQSVEDVRGALIAGSAEDVIEGSRSAGVSRCGRSRPRPAEANGRFRGNRGAALPSRFYRPSHHMAEPGSADVLTLDWIQDTHVRVLVESCPGRRGRAVRLMTRSGSCRFRRGVHRAAKQSLRGSPPGWNRRSA